jgi:cytochrome b561/polyisoprenoid-binding protein YceI
MNMTNTDDEYGLVAKTFHWLIAVMILALLPVGLFMGGMENSPLKFEVYALHKSFGILVFFLGLARIVWRLISPAPDHMETHKKWEIAMAGAAHFWLYVCIIGMPLSGWLMSSAGEFPVPFFGFQMPPLMDKNEQLGGVFNEVHEILGFTLIGVLALHIAGALKHHVLDKDETLQRMAWMKKGWLIPALVVLIAGGSYAAMVGGFVLNEMDEKENVTNAAPIVQETDELVDTSNLPEHGWAIVPSKSKLTFEASLYKTPFTGIFNNFSGVIIFNPEDLSSAFADITIDMAQIKSGDADRDKNMGGVDWFDVANFPKSQFVSKSFEKAGDGSYVAIGDVTIRGVIMPLIVPFDLKIHDKTAIMTARFSLNRGTFGVGQGQWKTDDTVGQTVDVGVELTVVQ